MKTGNNQAILKVILDRVKSEYKEDVSLVCCYGSYVNGTANEKSDVDFYYVPKTERARELSTSFIIDGIGYDFWGLSWERLERIVDFKEVLLPLVADSKVMYCCCEEDEKRFLELKEKVQKTKELPLNEKMLDKAEEHIKSAMAEYCNLLLARDATKVRKCSGSLLMDISNAVALMNNSYFAYGIKRQLTEIMGFKYIPVDFEQLYRSIVQTNSNEEIKDSCLKLIDSTYSLFNQLLQSARIKKAPKDVLAGFYEEACSTWNKIYIACDSLDANLALLAGICLQNELDYIASICEFPNIDLMRGFTASNLPQFKKAARQAEELMLEELNKAGIPILSYQSVEEFEGDYK